MADVYYDAEFAGIPIHVSKITTTDGRDIAVQSPSRGDRHTLNDRGRKHRVATAEILFIDKPGHAPYLERFDAVRALIERDVADVFSHPLIGTYRARIADFDHTIDSERLRVEVSCTILAEDEPQQVFQNGAGVVGAAGVESVEIAGAKANDALATAGLASDTPNECITAAQGWSEAEELDPQRVFLEAASSIEKLNGELQDLSSDLRHWPAYRALCELRYQVMRAAEAFTSEAQQLIDIVVDKDMPLIAICAEMYGPELAVERARQNAKLNRIRTPGLVRRGTALKMLAEGAG